MPRTSLLLAALISPVMLTAQTLPPVGQLCPPRFQYDSENCFRVKAPPNTAPGIEGTRFVYTPIVFTPSSTPPSCMPGFEPEGGKCYLQVPAGYIPFVYLDPRRVLCHNQWALHPPGRRIAVSTEEFL